MGLLPRTKFRRNATKECRRVESYLPGLNRERTFIGEFASLREINKNKKVRLYLGLVVAL
jgi:hypothetical protein